MTKMKKGTLFKTSNILYLKEEMANFEQCIELKFPQTFDCI